MSRPAVSGHTLGSGRRQGRNAPGGPRMSVRTCSPLSPTMLPRHGRARRQRLPRPVRAGAHTYAHAPGWPSAPARRRIPGVFDLIEHVAGHDEPALLSRSLRIHGRDAQRAAARWRQCKPDPRHRPPLLHPVVRDSPRDCGGTSGVLTHCSQIRLPGLLGHGLHAPTGDLPLFGVRHIHVFKYCRRF